MNINYGYFKENKVKTINYVDDTFENRVKKTVNIVVNEDAFVVAQYIVELEMRLESLGSNEHFDGDEV